MRSDSAGPTVTVSTSSPVRALPAVPVDVEGVVLGADRHHVPLDEVAHARWKTGVLPTKARAVDGLELAHRREDDDVLAVRALAPSGRGSRASRTCRRSIESSISGPWSWYGQAPTESLPAVSCVGPRLAGLDVAVAAGEAGQVRAVGARLVVHAVEVHGVRAVERRVQVLEVHAELVADAGPDQRPGHQVRVARAGRDVDQLACASSSCSAGRRRCRTPCRPAPYSMPMIASRPFGTMFQVAGTAATQYSRVTADAEGAASRLAAPAINRAVQSSLDGDGTAHEGVDQAVVGVRAGSVELDGRRGPAAASPSPCRARRSSRSRCRASTDRQVTGVTSLG